MLETLKKGEKLSIEILKYTSIFIILKYGLNVNILDILHKLLLKNKTKVTIPDEKISFRNEIEKELKRAIDQQIKIEDEENGKKLSTKNKIIKQEAKTIGIFIVSTVKKIFKKPGDQSDQILKELKN